MGKNNQNLLQQIELLTNQNKLIEQMNGLIALQNRTIQHKNSSSEEYVENINRDEMRSGFLVTSHRKKLWNVQIGLINEVARVCKKYNLKWWAIGGTLLGAARHKGFIPWDDDIDLVMFRPDYEKFRKVIPSELGSQYSFYAWYNFRLESDENLKEPSDDKLPFISREQQEKYRTWSPFFPLLRIINNGTTMMGHDDRKNFFTGIFIDILCFDPVPPFTKQEQMDNYRAARELFFATTLSEQIKEALDNDRKFIVPKETLQKIISLPYQKRAQFWESSMGKMFSASERVYHLKHHFYREESVSYATEDFEDTVFLPFEKIKIPCPVGYERVLSDKYGDWHKMMITHTHSSEYSTDIPYTEYYQKSGFVR